MKIPVVTACAIAAALFAWPAGAHAQTKAKPKEKPATQTTAESQPEKGKTPIKATTDQPKKAPDTSNKGGDTTGRNRALEAQKQGQGQESRGFETPKGLSDDKNKDNKDKDKVKDKDKDQVKSRSKDKDKENKDKDKSDSAGQGKTKAQAKKGKAS